MIWDNSIIKGIWDGYMSYANWGSDCGVVVWLVLHLLATAAQIIVIVWATGGDDREKQLVEEETWKSTSSL